MHTICLSVMAAASLAVTTTASALEWSDHYANARASAAQHQRPLLVVLENSAEPAQSFNAAELTTSEDQVELLKNFELCRMDVNSEYGKVVAKAFGVNTFPFTAITDKSAQYIRYKKSGAIAADQWKQTLETQKDLPPIRQTVFRPVIESYPMNSGSGSYCPNCVRNQYWQ